MSSAAPPLSRVPAAKPRPSPTPTRFAPVRPAPGVAVPGIEKARARKPARLRPAGGGGGGGGGGGARVRAEDPRRRVGEAAGAVGGAGGGGGAGAGLLVGAGTVGGGDGDAEVGVVGGAAGVAALLGSLDEYRQGSLRLEKVRHGRVHDAERRRLYLERVIRTTYDQDRRLAEDEFDVNRRNVALQMLRENTEKMRRVQELLYRITRDEGVNGAFSRRHEMSLRRGGRAAAAATAAAAAAAAAAATADAAAAAAAAATDPATAAGGAVAGYAPLGPGYAMIGSCELGDLVPPEEAKEKPTRRGKAKKEDAARTAAAVKNANLSLELDEEEISADMLAITGERPRPEPVAKDDAPARKAKKSRK